MLKRLVNISILLLLAFGSEALVASSPQAEVSIFPDCPFSNCDDHYLRKETETYIREGISRLALMGPSILSDQGFVTSIFRPPTSIH
jgi:hypothetical protein